MWKTRSGRWLKRKPGRRKGRKLSARALAACRTNPWKHGLRARVVSQLEAVGAKLNRALPEATAVIEAHIRALDDPEALSAIHVQAMVESELLRRKMVQEIRERGVLVEEPVLSRDGEVIGQNLQANPALEPMRHLDERLGHTAEQMQVTRKSQGEAEKTAELAAAFRLERDAALRAPDRPRRSLPPPKSFGR